MAAMLWVLLCAILFALLDVTKADIICGQYYCYGTGAYCCGDSCCFGVWTYWWFWMLWILLLIMLCGCGYGARRRYRARVPQYVVIQPRDGTIYGAQPVYGTVAYPTHGAYAQAAPPATQPTKPPSYTTVASPPPAYSTPVNTNQP